MGGGELAVVSSFFLFFLFCFLEKSFEIFQFPFLYNLLKLAGTSVRTLALANFKLACLQYHGNCGSR